MNYIIQNIAITTTYERISSLNHAPKRIFYLLKTITLIVLVLFPFWAAADVGDCYVFKAKYVMKNGESFTAYLPYRAYDFPFGNADSIKFKNMDKEFQKFLVSGRYIISKKYYLTVFEKYHVLKDDKLKSNKELFTNYGFTDTKSVKTFHLDSIKYTVFLGYKMADFADYHTEMHVFSSKTVNMALDNGLLNLEEAYFAPKGSNPGDADGVIVSFCNFNSEVSTNEFKQFIVEYKKLAKYIFTFENNYLESVETAKRKKTAEEKIKLWEEKGFVAFITFDGPC